MANELVKFRDGLFTKGYRTYGPEIDSFIQLHKDSHNLSAGIDNGIGPRYGMSPIPGHMHKEASAGDPKPLMQAEDTSDATSYTGRTKILGIAPFSFNIWDDPKKTTRHYCYLTVRQDSGKSYLDFSVGSSLKNSDEHRPDPNIAAGLPLPNPYCGSYLISNLATNVAKNSYNCLFWRDGLGSAFSDTNVTYEYRVDKLLGMLEVEDMNHASFCVVSVTGKREPINWFLCSASGTPSSTTTGKMITSGSPAAIFNCGYVPYFFTENFPKSRRGVLFYALYGLGGTPPAGGMDLPLSLACIYKAEIFDPEGIYTQTGNINYQGEIDPSSLGTMDITERADKFSPIYSDIVGFLVNDPQSFHTFQYNVFLAAVKKPLACIAQAGPNNENGTIIQPLDLSESFLPMYDKETIDYGTSDPYTEDGKSKNTCWKNFTLFESDTPLPSEGAVADGTSLFLGKENSGILRSETTYEITYSWYDKTTGHECNVGSPAKFRTDTNDFVRLCIYADNYISDFLQYVPYVSNNQLLDNSDIPQVPLNMLEIRFYYRALGSFEWLPAGAFDAANYYLNPDHRFLWLCEGEIAALPGGQPGGFVDYSTLPKDEYIDVKTFNGRAFWFSKKQIVFNLKNDLFSYPTRNIIPATTGDFLGGVVASYPGESDKYERLLVFATDNVYVGQFTGIKAQQPVRVSPYSIANFDVDGSDFVLNAWSSNTAFSHRSACVADGIPYWWGPDGIYKDNGSSLPVKVSDEIEPDLHNLYDPNKTDEIHSTFNPATKEIIWFYPPLEDDGYETHGLIFNVRKGEFYPAKWDGKIDWSQQIDISKDESNPHLAGKRVIVGARKDDSEDIQRAYFFDQRNRSGDIFPEREMMVKQISEPEPGQRRLTLADGYDPTNFATIAQGDYIAIHQGKKYGRSLTDCSDMIARVAAVSTDNGTVDIILPSGAVMDDTATLSSPEFFPFWHKAANGPGLHSFPYRALTRYWEPSGVNHSYFWLWLFARFKAGLWPSPDVFKDIKFGYKTPISNPNELIYNTIKMVENTDGHFSLYHQLPFGNGNTQGSAIKFDFSGHHLGNEWVLEYLEMHTQEESGNHLKMFEG